MYKAVNIFIAGACFYEDIAADLINGACGALDSAEAQYEVFKVPGAFELPCAVRIAINSGKFDGYVALGCVIRGETSHYDYVCAESARGLMDLSVNYGIALGYGILTTENMEQAQARASRTGSNKGASAANVCLKMIDFQQRLPNKID